MNNIHAFRRYNMNDIPEALRLLARQFEHLPKDDPKKPARCLILIETQDGGCEYRAFGEEPFTLPYAIGLCELTKDTLIGKACTGDSLDSDV